MAKGTGDSKQSCPYSKKQENEEPQDPKKHWIKFKIEDNYKKPVPNVTIQVILPDGNVEEKTSEIDGIIEIRNIPAGLCKIVSEWRECSVENVILID